MRKMIKKEKYIVKDKKKGDKMGYRFFLFRDSTQYSPTKFSAEKHPVHR